MADKRKYERGELKRRKQENERRDEEALKKQKVTHRQAQTSSSTSTSANTGSWSMAQSAATSGGTKSMTDSTHRGKDEISHLLCRLGLEKKYDDKLTCRDFLDISKSTLLYEEPRKEDQLVNIFMQRLLTADYRARHTSVKNKTNIADSQTSKKQRDNNEAYDFLFEKPKVKTERKHAEIHPMDVQMAVFLCADDFLRQIMVHKLSQCQYGIPLLVPNPFREGIECPISTMRYIDKSWKATDASGKIINNMVPVYKAETPMVAFFRLGSVSSSKSQLINNLINEKHSTFFHRHSPGSSRKRLLMDGVVEIAWYCPSGKSSDHFTECVAFCNLHGDSSRAGTQREILSTMASVNVILLPKPDKNDNNMKIVKELLDSSKPPIVVLTDEEEEDEDDVCEIKKGKYKMGLKGTTPFNLSFSLREVIKKCISQTHMTFNLEKMMNNSKVCVDEQNKECTGGKEAAQSIKCVFEVKDPLRVKGEYLPCQGKLWQDWCQISKTLRRLQSNNIEKELSEKKTEMKKLRQKQRDLGYNDLIRSFVRTLKTLSDTERKYFLRWTRIYMDEFTSETLLKIQQEYNKKWTEVLALKKTSDKAQEQMVKEKLKAKQSNLEQISEKLNAANFGLEHMLREMGQIYEASVSEEKTMTRKMTENWHFLPGLAADLMISGHPMELMDGDTAYVPLTWVSAVLNEVIKKLRDQRVFVLSVLGIQSSGKSTMLNAMFGLQFAVSAGRCTRGAFMQLVRVSEDMRKQLKIEYILVVDTEGLRSSELSGNTIHHDNEISTFVVGLGHVTLINIFGENPTEMQEILQIVVHAFLRMKKVRLNPSCMFVHQNVSDIAAKEKIMDGRRRLQETLDKMTKVAAKDEDYYTENFSDVIAFDIERDVKYFAQLWEGSPPMAPPNPGYSESIQELKRDILSRAETTDGLTLSQFQKRVEDLWNALLDENFVFSFKNAQEVSVYKKLEQEYGKWTWSLRSEMMSVEDKMLNRVASGEVGSVHRKDLIEEMRGTLKKVHEALNQYFEADDEKETLIQWKCKFERQIQHLHDDLIEEAKRKVHDSIQQKSVRQDLDKQRGIHEKNLIEKSKELALKLKGKGNSETHVRKEFDSMWKKWVSELTQKVPTIQDVNISKDITEVLGEVYKHDLVSKRKRNAEYKSIGIMSDYTEYLTAYKSKSLWQDEKKYSQDWFLQEMNKSVHDLINEVSEETKRKVESFLFSNQGYHSHYLQSIAAQVKSQVKEFEAQVKKDRQFPEDASVFNQNFYVDLSLYVCGRLEPRISRLHRKYKETNDPLIYFKNKKSEYFNIFQKYWEGATSAVILGDRVCNKLKEAILQGIYNMIAKFLCGQIREKPPFNGNRADLEKYILKSLAEQEGDKNKRFNNYLRYMNEPRVHFENFIKDRVQEFMAAENHNAASEIKNFIDKKQKFITAAAKKTSKKVKGISGNVQQWLEEFSKALADELGDTRVQMSDEDYKDRIDYDVLVKAIRKELNAVAEELKKNLSKISDLNMDKFRERPDDILIEHFCRCCWVQCPFCGAVCTNSVKDHPGDHMAEYHRSSGMKGWHYRNTQNLSIEFCTTNVASNGSFRPSGDSETSVPFKQYRTAGGKYAEWGISPDLSKLAYWKWFVCKFQENLENHYKKLFLDVGEIPDEWRNYSQSDAVKSLEIN